MFRIKKVQEDIQQAQDGLVDFQYHKSHSHWTQVGDRFTTEFFQKSRLGFSQTHLKQLKDENGNII